MDDQLASRANMITPSLNPTKPEKSDYSFLSDFISGKPDAERVLGKNPVSMDVM